MRRRKEGGCGVGVLIGGGSGMGGGERGFIAIPRAFSNCDYMVKKKSVAFSLQR